MKVMFDFGTMLKIVGYSVVAIAIIVGFIYGWWKKKGD